MAGSKRPACWPGQGNFYTGGLSKFLGALLGLAAVGALVYFALAGSGPAPPEVTFAAASRQTLVSTIITNGRIEPAVFATVRTELEGPLLRLLVTKGQRVAAGQELARLDTAALEAELTASQARIAQARAELAVIDQGGSAAALAELDGSLAAVKLDLQTARREAERSARLVEKRAETAEALSAAQDRIAQLEAQAAALERRRGSLVPSGSKDAAASRLRDAESALALSRSRITKGIVRSPIPGIVYHLAVRPDAFLRPGDAIAEVARTGAVKAVVYVDEPELGRVAKGMSVKITWDAMPGRSWDAVVDALPTQIVPLNSRQVGEVVCLLQDPAGELTPGANVNAEVRSSERAGALAIPKAALRREGSVTGVLVLGKPSASGQPPALEWRPVQLGVSSLTHAEILGGLRENERVALPGDTALTAGQTVTPRP